MESNRVTLRTLIVVLISSILFSAAYFLGREQGANAVMLEVGTEQADLYQNARVRKEQEQASLIDLNVESYAQENVSLEELLRNQKYRVYINPYLRLAFQYPVSWTLGRNRMTDNLWSLDFNEYTPSGMSVGSLEIQIHPIAEENTGMSITQYLREVHSFSGAVESYGLISGEEAVAAKSTIYFKKDGYYFVIGASGFSAETVRRVLDSVIFLPRPIRLTARTREVLERDIPGRYADPEYGVAFEYPEGWWIVRHGKHLDKRQIEIGLEKISYDATDHALMAMQILEVSSELNASQIREKLPPPPYFDGGENEPVVHRMLGSTTVYASQMHEGVRMHLWKEGFLIALYAKNVDYSKLDQILDSFIVNQSSKGERRNESASAQPWVHTGDE